MSEMIPMLLPQKSAVAPKKTKPPAPKKSRKKKAVKQVTAESLLPRAVADEELSTDGTSLLKFTLLGQAATKKNSQRITRWGILPSKQYEVYEELCAKPCQDAWVNKGHTPIDCGVSIIMRVFLKNWQVGDATGYMQSIADILQKFGVLKDDKWLHWESGGNHWFGGVDKENPRVEIELIRYRHPKEVFRKQQEEEEEAKKERARVRAEKTAKKSSISISQDANGKGKTNDTTNT